ncbi:cell division protein ZapA [Sphingomonas sp. AP4-R1]|uniref:cell division protein ZapA n=1 Tax=Sphingomonas sp. AP4-R1 TaxID=2735134 RepID=UPI001493D92C|nr:cell division protein ZapA [Sphingomonas sp. AP4-R1]QJU58820.1 cell division protein ZapA [Sphingomonas sp. AP4-R1]
MAQVTLDIAGRHYEMTVRDGQEAHFRKLAGIVDAKVRAVSGAMGTINEARQLLMASLLLADEMGNAPAPAAAAPAPPPPPPAPPAPAPARTDESMRAAAGQIDALAERIEKIAHMLEKQGQDI